MQTAIIHPRAAAAILGTIPKPGCNRDDYSFARFQFCDDGYTLSAIGVDRIGDSSRWKYNHETATVTTGDGASGCPVILLPRQVVADIAHSKAPAEILVDDDFIIINHAKIPRVASFALPVSSLVETGGVDTTLAVWQTVKDSIATATDQESSRYALGAVLIEPRNADEFFAIGSDGRRLHKLDAPAVDGSARGAQCLISAPALERFVASASKLFAPKKIAGRSLVHCEWSEDRVLWSIPGDYYTLTLSTSQNRGRFPRWRDVFPNRPDAQRFTIDAVASLTNQVKAAAKCTSLMTRGVYFKNGSIMAHGNGEYSAPCAANFGDMVTCLDPQFLLDILASCENGATVEYTDKRSAVLFRSERFSAITMPCDL
jgi:hypothetical protein